MRHHKMHPYMQQSMRQQQRQRNNHVDRYDEMEPEEFEENLPVSEDDSAMLPEVESGVQEEKTPEHEKQQDKEVTENPYKKEMEELRLRTAAEMDNFKKRLSREHQEQMKYASEKVLKDIIPAIDNLDLALQYATTHEACKDMVEGVAMTKKLLLESLERNGLKSVGKEGDEFNPQFHEAIGYEANPEVEKGVISKILQRGYILNDRLLRPAKVMINQ